MNCPNCGSNVNQGDVFCRVCGAKILWSTPVNDGGVINNNDSTSTNNAGANNVNSSLSRVPEKYRQYLPPENKENLSGNFQNNVNGESNNIGNGSNNTNEEFILKDKLIKAYIGLKYDDFAKGGFSWCTFFFGWSYYLYRRMYKLGLIFAFIGIINCILSLKVSYILFQILSFGIGIFLSINFKKWYLEEVAKRVDNYIKTGKDLTEEELVQKVAKAGGTDFKAIFFWLVYSIFVSVLTVLMIFSNITNLTKDYIQLSKDTINGFTVVDSKSYVDNGVNIQMVEFEYDDKSNKCTLIYEDSDAYSLSDYDSIEKAAVAYYSDLSIDSSLLQKKTVNGIEFWNYSSDNKVFYAFSSSKYVSSRLIFKISKDYDGKCLEYKDNIFNNVHYLGK